MDSPLKRSLRVSPSLLTPFALSWLLACSSEVPLLPEEPSDREAQDAEVPDAAQEASLPQVDAGAACAPLDPRDAPVDIAAMPESGEAPFVNALLSAKKAIRVMIYQMGFGGILDTLKAKAEAGIDVQVILDVGQRDVNDKYRVQLEASGAKVKWSDPKFPYMHAKMILVDAGQAVISTGNYSKSYMLKERNFVATLRDSQDLAVLEQLFRADYEQREPNVSCTRLLVSPVNARQRLLEFVKSAKSTMEVESMQLGDRGVRDAILERARAGVNVRVLLADPGWIDANAEAFRLLKTAGIPAKTRPHLHTKAIIVDGVSAYMGSINMSSTSLNKNREVGFLTAEAQAVGVMRTTFETDWAAGTTP